MSDWKNALGGFFEKTEQTREQRKVSDFTRFLSDVTIPAFEELRDELEKHGRTVTIRATDSSATLIVCRDDGEELAYRIQGRTFPTGVLPYAEARSRERKGLRMVTSETPIRSGAPTYSMADITRAEIIRHFLDLYMRRVQPA